MPSSSLYKRIIDFLKSRIIDGSYDTNMQLPTEAELAKQFNTSRNTVIKALDILKNEGYIVSIQGKGSFVSSARNAGQQSLARIVSLILPFREGSLNRIDEYDVIRGIETFLRNHNCRLMIHYSNDNPGTEAELVYRARSEGNDGVIVYPSTIHNNLPFMYDIHLDHYPMVFIDRCNPDIPGVSIQSDNIRGGLLAAQFLLEKGYDDIYFVSDVQIELVSSVKDRYFGYCQALKQAGRKIDGQMLINGYAMKDRIYQRLRYEDNPDVFQDIIRSLAARSGKKRIGVFADNDLAAYSIIKASIDLNFQIGDQIGVVGFNNAQVATMSQIPITTIKQDFFRIGELSAQALLDYSKKPLEKKELIYVDVELIVRKSA